MPFSNEVVGGVTLVRNAIQSANYVAGVSGWKIDRTGNAEFNQATIRGVVHVVGPDGSEITIDISDGFASQKFIDSLGNIWRFDATILGVSAPSFIISGEQQVQPQEIFMQGEGIFWQPDNLSTPGLVLDVADRYMKTTSGLVAGKEAWHSAVLQNGWTNFGSGYAPLQYRKLPHGYVGIEGTIKPGTTVDGTTVTTLPIGYRPLYVTRRIPAMEKISPAMMADVQTDGQVKIIGAAGATTVSFQAQVPVIDV